MPEEVGGVGGEVRVGEERDLWMCVGEFDMLVSDVELLGDSSVCSSSDSSSSSAVSCDTSLSDESSGVVLCCSVSELVFGLSSRLMFSCDCVDVCVSTGVGVPGIGLSVGRMSLMIISGLVGDVHAVAYVFVVGFACCCWVFCVVVG